MNGHSKQAIDATTMTNDEWREYWEDAPADELLAAAREAYQRDYEARAEVAQERAAGYWVNAPFMPERDQDIIEEANNRWPWGWNRGR